MVKNSLADAGDKIDGQVQSVGWEDPLEKEMATHSSILAWIIPRAEEPGRLQSVESQRVAMTEQQIRRESERVKKPT